jgi:hypothetical protein
MTYINGKPRTWWMHGKTYDMGWLIVIYRY